MSKWLKLTLNAFSILTVLFGLALTIAPGRFLGFFGWAPIDPLISRMFGAALVGLAWGSERAVIRGQPAEMVQINAVFCVMAVGGLLRNMWGSGWPFMVWFVLGLYAIFGILFLLHWPRGGTRKDIP